MDARVADWAIADIFSYWGKAAVALTKIGDKPESSYLGRAASELSGYSFYQSPFTLRDVRIVMDDVLTEGGRFTEGQSKTLGKQIRKWYNASKDDKKAKAIRKNIEKIAARMVSNSKS